MDHTALSDLVHPGNGQPTNSSVAPASALLAGDEPEPVEILNQHTGSDFFLICEHAGRRIPRKLGTLGLEEPDLSRHIAWDIGARDIATSLSQELNAPLYMQRYSRLVCDCNRQPTARTYAPELSEATRIPGNANLSQADLDARTATIFRPFHDAVAQALDQRRGQPTFLITIHTFTPVFLGAARPWQIGVLFNRDNKFSPAIVKWLQENTDLTVGINQPYSVSDETDYAIPVHGEARGLPCVEFEVRNDLVSTAAQAAEWAVLIARAVRAARMGI